MGSIIEPGHMEAMMPVSAPATFATSPIATGVAPVFDV